MRKTVLYIAMSLDGYIADENGDVGWLEGYSGIEGSWEALMQRTDTVFMGRRTYDQITNELSPSQWVYADRQTFVFTHRPLPSCENICFTERSPIALLDELQAQEGKDIWICGGAQIIRTLMEDDRIDVYQLTILPVLLGAGIPLFERLMDPCRLRLIETTVQGDVVELRYGRSFHICRMQPSQLERVASIWLSGNEQAHAFLPAGFWRSLYPQVKEQLAQAEIYVCEQKGTVCGFIGMRETRIEGLFVDAGCRGQGVGSALLADVKKRRDVLRLQVYRQNVRALAFYRRFGFVVVEEHVDPMSGEMEYVMEWRKNKSEKSIR